MFQLILPLLFLIFQLPVSCYGTSTIITNHETTVTQNIQSNNQFYATAAVLRSDFQDAYEDYSNMNADLFNSITSLNNQADSNVFYDPLLDYSVNQLLFSYYTIVSTSLKSQFDKDIESTYSNLYSTQSNTIPFTATPTSSSWDTKVTGTTIGSNSKLYNVAKCRALVNDIAQYANGYNQFWTTYNNSATLTSYQNTASSILFNDDSRSKDKYCADYVSLVELLPWKERVLANAKLTYVSMTSSLGVAVLYGSDVIRGTNSADGAGSTSVCATCSTFGQSFTGSNSDSGAGQLGFSTIVSSGLLFLVGFVSMIL